MRYRASLIPPLLLLLTGVGSAQTKMSGELKCEKAEPRHSLPAGDRAGHVFEIGKSKCTWTKPFMIEGLAAVSEEVTFFREVTGEKARARSVNVGTMKNGDKYYVSTQSTSVMKDGVLQTADVQWTWTGGTGKLKGVTAKGTSKGTGSPDGTAIWVAQGEYQIKK